MASTAARWPAAHVHTHVDMQVCTRACTNAHLRCGVAASLITHLRKNSAARLEYADLHAPAGLYRKVMLAIALATNGDIVDLGMQANAVTNVLRQNSYDEQIITIIPDCRPACLDMRINMRT